MTLTDADLQHATHLITSGKVETAVEACKVLEDNTGKTLNPQTVRKGLKQVVMKSVVKTNRPFLSRDTGKRGWSLLLLIKTGL